MLTKQAISAITSWSLHTDEQSDISGARASFRAFARATWGDCADVAMAELVVGELLGNVARHAPGAVVFQARWDIGTIAITVRDKGPGFTYAPARVVPSYAESGRGLEIVAALATRMEVRRTPRGAVVRAIVAVTPDGVEMPRATVSVAS